VPFLAVSASGLFIVGGALAADRYGLRTPQIRLPQAARQVGQVR
jgi:hypothetical protein